jgi:hypothetical protein
MISLFLQHCLLQSSLGQHGGAVGPHFAPLSQIGPLSGSRIAPGAHAPRAARGGAVLRTASLDSCLES